MASIASRVDSLNLKAPWSEIRPVLRELSACVIGRHFHYFREKEELFQEAEIKAHQLINSPHRDPRRSLYSFLYTGLRNQLGNFIKKNKSFLELDEERHAEEEATPTQSYGEDDIETRALMVQKFLDDRSDGGLLGTSEEDVRLFLKIVSAKTSVKEAHALGETSLSGVALVALFLFSGRSIRFPSDETLERYLRYVGIYKDSMKGVSVDDISKKYDVRKGHLPRIIETVQEIIDGSDG